LVVRQCAYALPDMPLNGVPIIAMPLRRFTADGRESHQLKVELLSIVHI
jgi:hypothetical protein